MENQTFKTDDLYVSTHGNNSWSGSLPEPNGDRTDGPFATIERARDEIRRRKSYVFSKQAAMYSAALRGPVTVWIRGGVYGTPKPIVFEPIDSAPVCYHAYPGETPIIDGSERIEGFAETTVNGKDAWVADVGDARFDGWSFRELFVNGERRSRPRFPKNNLLTMESVPGLPKSGSWQSGRGYTRFVARDGDIRQFKQLEAIDVVYLHFWIEERTGIESYDSPSRTVTMKRPSAAPLFAQSGSALADYYLDNVFEELTEPGEWYLDRPAGKVYYIPQPGEKIEEVEISAPRALQLMALKGDPENNEFVEFLRFEGITFQHTDWRHPDPSDGAEFITVSGDHSRFESRRHFRGKKAAASQAACDVPGVIFLEAARHCSFVDCTVQNVGWYGFEIADACRGVAVDHCTIRQTGGGGVKINGSSATDPLQRRTGDHAITHNEIFSCGRIFHSAVGVLVMNSFNTDVSHNHIYDLFYTGISCGWKWGYMENVARDNRIEKNHIHQIGQGVLSDMGGIYTLGVQPGTVIRGNLIHDIEKAHYGGWCIYPDEGSSHMLIENNVCYDTNDTIFNQHYGRENLVRNNVFAFASSALLSHSKAEYEHCSIRFERNLLITNGEPVFRVGYHGSLDKPNHSSDLNLIWDAGGKQPRFIERDLKTEMTLDEWLAVGHDHHSIFEDPKFRNLAQRDFTLMPDSPTGKIDWRPIDLSDVGPQPR